MWISVKDRLPERYSSMSVVSGLVNVKFESGEERRCQYNYIINSFQPVYKSDGTSTHWQPVTQPVPPIIKQVA
jgi:Protein of unknown function (DUF551)